MGVLAILFMLVHQSPLASAASSVETSAPVRIGVVGLVHGHVGWILGREALGDVEVVGIAEADHELVMRLGDRYGFDMTMVYPSVEEMLDTTQPEAVTVFSKGFIRNLPRKVSPYTIHGSTHPNSHLTA